MWQLAEDTIDQHDLDALADWLKTHPHLTQGPEVRAFEAAWADWCHSPHAVFTSSGTTANLALVALAAERADKPAYRERVVFGCAALTWSTNLTPALLLGHDLHLFDVDPRTLGVDKAQVCEAIRQRHIDVLFVTHLLGLSAFGGDDEILNCAAEHGVVVIEDACEAPGATHQGRKLGTLGLGGTYSFYYGHHMSTIEGGMIVTHDERLDDALRLFRAHGLARESRHYDDLASAHPDIHRAFLFIRAGLNLRNSDVGAFLGQRQLGRLDTAIARRNDNLAHFLRHLPEGYWRDFATEGVSSFSLPLIADTPARADATLKVVSRLGIEHRPVVGGDLSQQPFLTPYGDRVSKSPLDVTRHIHRCGIYVGNHGRLTTDPIDQLCAALAEL